MLASQSIRSALGLLVSATLFQHTAAQVTTDCQPLNRTDCPPDPAFGMEYNFNFNQTPIDGTWETTKGNVPYDRNDGATFTINQQGESPTIRSKFYIFFGRVEIWMRAAPGTGIISSIMLLSDDLDEIDWEFMGGNATHAETNYFGKGVDTNYGTATYHPVAGGILDDYHNYTAVWTKDALDFFIDSQHIRTLLPKQANNTYYYPQTPMRISVGIWAGGDPSLPQGTRDWAGGDTDFSKGPFSMHVKSIQVTDFTNQAKEYSYGDKSGSWESIRVVSGNSTVHEKITAPPPESIGDKWAKLSPTAKIAVYASAAGVGTALLAWMVFYCIRQRRRGAREARIAEAKAEEEQREIAALKAAGINPDSFVVEQTEYDAKEMRRDGISNADSYSVPTPTATTPTGMSAAAAAAAAAGSGPRSPMPLLSRDGAQSPRVASPGPYGGNPAYDRSMAGGGAGSPAYPLARLDRSATASPQALVSPMHSPGHQQQRFAPPQGPNRSFSSPNAHMRVGSPGPGGQQRTQSPAQQQHPQRSYTAGGGGGYAPRPGGGGGGYEDGRGGYGGGGGQGGNDGYWGTGGYR